MDERFERHHKTHKKGKKSSDKFNCSDCGVQFSGQTALRKHEQTSKHIQNATKYCPHCNEKFTSGKALEFHILKEHEASDIQCEQCDMVFGQFHLLQHHIKTVHNATTSAVDDKPDDTKGVIKKEELEGVVIEEFIIDSFATETEVRASASKDFTVIAKDNEVSPEFEKSKIRNLNPPNIRAELKKSLSDCLRVETPKKEVAPKVMSADDVEITENVGKLLDLLVDVETLVKFGWPEDGVENVLCKVIENCGYNLYKTKFTEDYGSRMREFVKLLFTVVIQNDSIKELLNNYSIDEVIEFVLSNDDVDD